MKTLKLTEKDFKKGKKQYNKGDSLMRAFIKDELAQRETEIREECAGIARKYLDEMFCHGYTRGYDDSENNEERTISPVENHSKFAAPIIKKAITAIRARGEEEK